MLDTVILSRRRKNPADKNSNLCHSAQPQCRPALVAGFSANKGVLRLIPPVQTNSANSANTSKIAFTLAEVLITLGIIGVVAAMTLPGLIQNYQAKVRQNQFKKAYSIFFNAIKQAQASLEYPVGCSYWTTGGLCNAFCTEIDPVYNTCIKWTCGDGSAIPSDTSGPRNDCAEFEEQLFTKTLKVTKFCQNNALTNGCLTKDYRGTDKIKTEQNPDAEFPPNPNSNFSDNNIKVKYSSWILADGILIMKYGNYKSGNFPIYTIDINGHKGPNKWGYDLFTFQLMGDNANGITQLAPGNYATEKGGVSAKQMMTDMYK